MKTVELIGHQGDVVIFKVDEFPVGERTQDELTIKGQLALGELTGHNHYFEDTATVDLFKMPTYPGLSFFETKAPSKLIHGLIRGWQGKEADKEYHAEIVLKEGEKYVTGIVEETDWLTKTIRRVVD